MYTLVFTMTLYGLTMKTEAAKFETKEMCEIVAHNMSGPNWVGSCKEPISLPGATK